MLQNVYRTLAGTDTNSPSGSLIRQGYVQDTSDNSFAPKVYVINSTSGGSSGSASPSIAVALVQDSTGAYFYAVLTEPSAGGAPAVSYISLSTGLPAAPTGALSPATREQAGSGNVRYLTDTTAITGAIFRQVVCLTTTVFTTFTRTNATGSLVGITLPAGTLLIGPVTAITLTSGAVACYD